ncbi:unnamed protein product [Ceratitis capitata]|uniref:(Mediterranean fruit fly) hypothetical protein n=1 Tax=Ceratitis capitata TaxID=7213 RepID=A0A811UGK6_CERCA|nr:unnamed protein product [Ceratitis capitata]
MDSKPYLRIRRIAPVGIQKRNNLIVRLKVCLENSQHSVLLNLIISAKSSPSPLASNTSNSLLSKELSSRQEKRRTVSVSLHDAESQRLNKEESIVDSFSLKEIICTYADNSSCRSVAQGILQGPWKCRRTLIISILAINCSDNNANVYNALMMMVMIAKTTTTTAASENHLDFYPFLPTSN